MSDYVRTFRKDLRAESPVLLLKKINFALVKIIASIICLELNKISKEFQDLCTIPLKILACKCLFPNSETLLNQEFAVCPIFEDRMMVCYSALFTNLVGWHASVVSFPLSDVILA